VNWAGRGNPVPLGDYSWKLVAPVAVVDPDTGHAGDAEQCDVTISWGGEGWALSMSSVDLARIEPEPVASDA
jgi:hypothetical protein